MAFDQPEDDNLRPLPPDLGPEARSLAEFLRKHFYRCDMSLRHFAETIHLDPGVVSRYLSGARIPPQPFVDALLAVAGPQRSPEEVMADPEQARELRLNALQVRNARAAEAERIAQQLSDANEEVRRHQVRERLLTDALTAAEEKYAALLLDRNQQAVGSGRLKRLSDERDRALEEVHRLERELEKEKLARKEAENRSAALLAELGKANAALARSGGSVFGIFAYRSPGLVLTILRGNEARWRTLLALVATFALIRGVPLYLGFVYHFAYREEPLRVLAVCGLLIPVWFAVSARRTARPGIKGNVGYFIWVVATTALLFFVAALI
jgi:hypothetical protein